MKTKVLTMLGTALLSATVSAAAQDEVDVEPTAVVSRVHFNPSAVSLIRYDGAFGRLTFDLDVDLLGMTLFLEDRLTGAVLDSVLVGQEPSTTLYTGWDGSGLLHVDVAVSAGPGGTPSLRVASYIAFVPEDDSVFDVAGSSIGTDADGSGAPDPDDGAPSVQIKTYKCSKTGGCVVKVYWNDPAKNDAGQDYKEYELSKDESLDVAFGDGDNLASAGSCRGCD